MTNDSTKPQSGIIYADVTQIFLRKDRSLLRPAGTRVPPGDAATSIKVFLCLNLPKDAARYVSRSPGIGCRGVWGIVGNYDGLKNNSRTIEEWNGMEQWLNTEANKGRLGHKLTSFIFATRFLKTNNHNATI